MHWVHGRQRCGSLQVQSSDILQPLNLLTAYRKLWLPSLLSAGSMLLFKLFLSNFFLLIPLSLTLGASFVTYFMAAVSCKDECNDIATAPGIVVAFQAVQILHLCLHVTLLSAPVAVWMSRKKCECCGLSSCLLQSATINARDRPYFLWKYNKL